MSATKGQAKGGRETLEDGAVALDEQLRAESFIKQERIARMRPFCY